MTRDEVDCAFSSVLLAWNSLVKDMFIKPAVCNKSLGEYV